MNTETTTQFAFAILMPELEKRRDALTWRQLEDLRLEESPSMSLTAIAAIDAVIADLASGAAAVREAVRQRLFARLDSSDPNVWHRASAVDAPLEAAERATLLALRDACLERVAQVTGPEVAARLLARSEARLCGAGSGGPPSIDRVAPADIVSALATELTLHVVAGLELTMRGLVSRFDAVVKAAEAGGLLRRLGLYAHGDASPEWRDAVMRGQGLTGPALVGHMLDLFAPHTAAAAKADGSLHRVEKARHAAVEAAREALAQGADPHQRPEMGVWDRQFARQFALKDRYAHLQG